MIELLAGMCAVSGLAAVALGILWYRSMRLLAAEKANHEVTRKILAGTEYDLDRCRRKYKLTHNNKVYDLHEQATDRLAFINDLIGTLKEAAIGTGRALEMEYDDLEEGVLDLRQKR